MKENFLQEIRKEKINMKNLIEKVNCPIKKVNEQLRTVNEQLRKVNEQLRKKLENFPLRGHAARLLAPLGDSLLSCFCTWSFAPD